MRNQLPTDLDKQFDDFQPERKKTKLNKPKIGSKVKA